MSALRYREIVGRLRRQIDEELFPPAAESGLRLSKGEGALVIGAFLLIATALSILRLGTDGYRTVWAEDSTVFLQAAFNNGYWHAVIEPYAGYLNMGPRLIGGLGEVFPLQDAAAIIAGVSAFFAALSGLAVWFGSAGHVRNIWLRAGLTIGTALAATAGLETLDSAAYVPWFTLIGTFWLLFLRPKTWWGAVLAGAFVLFTGLSTPGVWFFTPVAALRIFSLRFPRDRRVALVTGAWLLGGLIQIPVLLAQEQGESMWSRHIWTALVQRVISGGIFGEKIAGGLWDQFGWKFLVLLCLVLAIGLVRGLRRSPISTRWFVPLAIAISFAMFIFSVYQRSVGLNIFWSPGTSGSTASRYVLVPASLFLAAFVVLLDGVIRDRVGRGLRSSWPAVAGTLLILIGVGVAFNQTDPIRSKPYWSEALRAAADKCITNEEEAAGIAAAPVPFGIVITCPQVDQFASPSVRDTNR
ncbi:MAG TPA: hypothetical protein VHA80_15250 [Solirubrobacterales bacterium]|nr:hypothetical protein [Solirubrobacterales bacterium]